ncbi:MAG TPA: ABC transporter ATP-binding protein [Acidimicrobiia bacterium]|nr:ABC transporter ATP-binding protein [Acidimicrobiia bacterium]
MSVDARIGIDFDQFSLDDVELRVEAGTTVAIVGPNGAGKSTIVHALAGTLPLHRGRITLGDRVVDDVTQRVFVPPAARSVGVVLQDSMLFPHLSVLENVAFGPRARGTARHTARRIAHEWLERLGVAAHAGKRPRALSGGQAQRVALARALATDPDFLLLDEPLSALDARTRPTIRRELMRHLADFLGTAIVVTHDAVEAMTLADQLVAIEGGRITQQGDATELRERPRSRYIADLVGVNLYRGTADGDGILTEGGARIVATGHDARGPALAVVHPRAVALHVIRPHGTPRNVWTGTVVHIDPEGSRARVHVEGVVPITAEITMSSIDAIGVTEGSPVWVSVKATEVEIYPA